jgi:uncharacterized protein YndB with AHSA1/START domain
MDKPLTLSVFIPAPPQAVYRAWLDSEQHTQFTGSPALIDPREGGEFTAWDGYIRGTILELDPDRRILQAWRTTDFSDQDSDSRVEIHLEEAGGGANLRLLHSQIPDNQADGYAQGWQEYYFDPILEYFKGKTVQP